MTTNDQRLTTVQKVRVLPPMPELIGREPAIPIHPVVYSYDQYDIDCSAYPGRVLIGHYDSHTGEMKPDLLDHVRPNDIVFVPLFGGQKLPDRMLASSTADVIDRFDENIEWLRRNASRCGAILVGNAGPESSFKHLYLRDTTQPRTTMSDHMCLFVRDTWEIVRSFGGRVAHGYIDWDLANDCYMGESTVRDLCNSIGAINICFAGYQLFTKSSHGPYDRVPSPDDRAFWRCCPHDEPPFPRPILTEYLRGWKNGWTGMDGIDGIRRGNDALMGEHGFSHGVVAMPISEVV